MRKESKYIFRRVVSGVLIALILTFIKGCDVYASTFTTYMPYNELRNVRIRNDGSINAGTQNNGITGINVVGWDYSNLTIVNSENNFFQFTLANSINILNNYDNFMFTIYTKNLILSGSIDTSTQFKGYCTLSSATSNSIESYDVPSTSYPRESYGLYAYTIYCTHDKTSTGNSRIDIPIQLLNYADQSIYMSYYWTLWNNDNSVSQAQAQAHQDSVNTQNKIDNINDTINDSSVDNQDSFFSDFDEGETGTLMDLISLPIDFIDSLNNSCQAIELPHLRMYSFDFQLTIPCMSSFVYSHFSTTIINTLKLIINGFLVYYMLKWFIGFIQDLKDPNNDDLEVMDL